ncbi:unnamed protein product [Lactuca saligna]|uniref:Uncharacterized protein n=1 Tax=Lactuca saligna TaxID=75948 RepID=A0AA35UXW7_LACSI|nr:unnamed protein product [Lactuca saligna]
MDDDQQGVHFYQVLVTQECLRRILKKTPMEALPWVNRWDPKCNRKRKDVEEAHNEPHLSKAPSDPRTVQKGDAYHLHSLEEEITNLKCELFATEARVVRAEGNHPRGK